MDELVTGGKRRLLQVRKPARNAITSARRRRFLEHLAATCNVKSSSKATGISFSALYVLRRNDADFAAAWDEAIQTGYDRLEEALLAHALKEVEPTDFDPAAVTVELSPDGTDARSARAKPTISGKVALTSVQLALDLLNRRNQPSRKGRAGRRPASVEAVEKALGDKLDALARRITEGKPGRGEA